MKRQDEVTLKEALNQLLETYRIKPKLKRFELEHRWNEIVGPLIARHTKEMYLKQDVLVLKFSSSAVKQEIVMMKSKLVERINEAMEERIVRDILVL